MRASRRRRVVGAALVVAVVGGGAVGCAGEGESAPRMEPAAAVAKAAANADEITSVRYRMSGRTPEEGRIKAEAQLRLKPAIAMSMKVTALDKGKDGEGEIRLVDKAMYIGGSSAAAELDGKKWMKFDLSGLDKGGAGSQSLGAGAGQADKNPAQESTMLTGSDDVKEVGTETLDGVKTTHYRGTVTLDDWRKKLKSGDAKTRERREKTIQQYEKLGVDKLTMDMWIDGENHTKQFRMKGDADKGPLDMTITFLDINKPVTVQAPPAKETVDLAEMMKEIGKS